MSANLESLFYAGREVPWHGLGTQVDEAPTSADAIRLAGLDWLVTPKEVFTDGRMIPGYRANVRESDGSVLGIVSDKYRIVQNVDAFDFTDALLENDDGVFYETAGSLRGGRTIWLLAKMPKQRILGDEFEPYMCFTNSHDGSGAIRVCMTPIRVVCNNTLNLALKGASRQWSARHTGSIDKKLAEAESTLGLAEKYMAKLDEEAQRLANRSVTDEEIEKILDELFPVVDKTSVVQTEHAKDAKDSVKICYMMPDISQFRGTAYGLLNALTDFVGHAAPVRKTQNYQANNFERIIGGHPIVDKAYKLLTAVR